MSAQPNMLVAALGFAGAGINIFPVDDQKVPLTGKGGFHHATRDRAQIEAWWKDWPDAGIATPDFDVLDVDLYKPGVEVEWQQIKSLIPATTPQTKTPRGGFQFFFEAGSLNGAKFGNGIDLRYAGRNYVLLPPSRFADHGRYEFVVALPGRKPKPAPEFPAAMQRRGLAPKVEGKIPYGSQHDTLVSYAGSMRARGMTPDEIDAALQIVNANRCERPGPVENIRKIAESSVAWTPADDAQTATQALAWQPLSVIEMRSIVFVDKPLLQASGFHLLAGRKGIGKGTWLADTAARITRGELGEKTNVVWIGTEDSAEIDIKPRIVAAGGLAENVALVKDWPQLPRDVKRLAGTIAEVGNVGLAIIDPVGNHITGKSSNGDTDIRDAIAPLNHLSDGLQTMLIGVRHLTEKEITGGALAAILGASAWVQVPRAVLIVARDNDDPGVVHIQCVAGNRLPPETPGRTFRIVGAQVAGLENEVTRAVWIGDSSKDVEQLLTMQAGKKTSASDRARELILDVLETAPGRQMESDTLDARIAAETGLAKKTVQNVRTELRDKALIKFLPERDEFGAIERWTVARTLAPRPAPSQIPSPDPAPPGLDPDSAQTTSENGVVKPDPAHIPNAEKSGCSEPDPEMEVRDHALLDDLIPEGANGEYADEPNWLEGAA